MIARASLLLALTGIALSTASVWAQPAVSPDAEVGRPLVRNYSPLVYNAHQVNYMAAQDARGVMYFANGDGLLEYDGASWRFIKIHTDTRAYALVADADGTLFVGAEDDVGYLAPDPHGRMQFVSLRPHLPEGAPGTFNAYQVHATSAGIFFNTYTHLLRWDGKAFHVWSAATPFTRLAQVGDRVLVGSAEGVLEVRGDTLHMLPGTASLGTPFEMALRYDANRLLLGTARHLFLYDGEALVPFLEATTLGDGVLFTAIRRLQDGTLVLGTQGAGVFHTDVAGRLLRVINEASGLRDEEVLGLFLDRDEGLWISLMDGLAWIDPLSAVTYFDPNDGLRGQPEMVVRHQGQIYCATTTGVFRLAPARPPHHPVRFEAVAGIDQFTYGLRSHDAGLIAVTQSGVYLIDGLQATPLAAVGAYDVARWPEDPHALILGGVTGLFSLRYDPQRSRWGSPETVGDLNSPVRVMVQGVPGELWLILLPGGLARVTFPNAPGVPPEIVRFGPEHGLPPGELSVIPTADGVFIQALEGLFRLDETTQRFEPDPALGEDFAQGQKILIDPIVTPNGVWSSVITGDSNATLHTERFYGLTQGRYQTDTLAVLRLLPPIIAWDFHVDGATADAIAWIATSEGLFRYDPLHKRTHIPVRPLLRNVTLGDTLVFGGQAGENQPPPTFMANHEGLRLSYALPVFDAPGRTRYQVRLDGMDERWSGWIAETWKDYTNLPGGRYRFRVRARDVYGRISEAAAFSFTVRPPWYRTSWAYLLFVLLGGGVIGGGMQWRLAYLKQRTRLLQRTVAERTQEIARQNEQLAVQATRMRELDEAKTRFFANISHELRTPLTLILGPLDQLYAGRDGKLDAELHAQLGMMLRNGQRLQRLINQILDLTKLEAKALVLDRRPHDLAAFVARHVRLYEGLAKYKGVALSFQGSAPTGRVVFDAEQMEKVLANLLSNAIKFTDTGGQVSVTVEVTPEDAAIRVADTGMGITPEKLSHVFDRFYQAEDSTTRSYEGTGIGLALVKELVDLHGGTVHAASQPGQGSTFTVRLPVTPDAETAEPLAQAHAEDAAPQEPHAAVAVRVPPDPSETQPPAPQVDQTTVLVVDDNADMRTFVHAILAPKYRVLEAADGVEGLRLAREALPDLILADVMMPKMDGLAMSRALHEDPTTGSIPVVLLTARAALTDRVEGLATGADAYLSKPFDAGVLQLQVGNLIARQQHLREQLRQDPNTLPLMPPPKSAFEARVCEIIEQHLSDPQFSVERLADEVALSRQQLYRKLRDETDLTPVVYIRQFRLTRAARLLYERQGNVSEVAYAVGFNSLSYFTRCFHEHFEETPSAYVLRNTERA